MNTTKGLKELFRQGLSAKITALESVKKELANPGNETYNSVRRLAHAVEISAKTHGYTELETAAQAVIREPEMVMETNVDRLLEIMRQCTTGEEEHTFKILVIEDTEDIARLIALTLQAPNRQILIAETCALAKQILDEEEVSLILLDLVLPDMDGRTLLMELRERPKTAAIPIFVLTSQGGSQPQTECHALGADEFFHKPFDPKMLAQAVASRLQRSADMTKQARVDSLTGLPNRAAFNEALVKKFAQAASTKQVFSLALVDMDHYEMLKSVRGKEIGHQAIQHVADIVAKHVGDKGTTARWESSILAILFPDIRVEQAGSILQDALDELRGSPLRQSEGTEIPLTFSAGAIDFDTTLSVVEAISLADQYLYHAKSMGRNRILSTQDSIDAIKKKILLVEDDVITATVIIHKLKRDHLDVLHCTDGGSAYEALQKESISLAIFDVNVPVMDGFELIERIRNMPTYSDLPVIILTSMGSEKDIERGFALGANDYMLKPFSPVELLARIHRHLKHVLKTNTDSA